MTPNPFLLLILCVPLLTSQAIAQEFPTDPDAIGSYFGGISYSSDTEFVAHLGLTLTKLPIENLAFSIAGKAGAQGKEGTAQLHFLRPIDGFGPGYGQQVGFEIGAKITDWNSHAFGKTQYFSNLYLQGRFDDATSYRTGLFWQNDEILNPDDTISPIISGETDAKTAAGLSLELDYNTLDDIALPQKGLNFGATARVSGLGNIDRKYKALSAYSKLAVPFNETTALIATIQAGAIDGIDGKTVSAFDRAYLGGGTVPRGFAVQGIGPRDKTSTVDSALGGTRYATASLNLQHKINETIALIGFMDTGSLWNLGENMTGAMGQIDDNRYIRQSVGLALNMRLPQGLISISYAHATKHQPNDITQPLNINFKLSF